MWSTFFPKPTTQPFHRRIPDLSFPLFQPLVFIFFFGLSLKFVEVVQLMANAVKAPRDVEIVIRRQTKFV